MFDMGFQAETKLSREEATRLYLASQAIMPVNEIARRAGVTRQTLHNWAQNALRRIEKTPAPDTSTGSTPNSEAGQVSADTPDITQASTTESNGGK